MKSPREFVVDLVFGWLKTAEPKPSLLFHLEPKGTVEPPRLKHGFKLWLLKKLFPDAYLMFVCDDTWRWELYAAHLEKDPEQQKADEEAALKRFLQCKRAGIC